VAERSGDTALALRGALRCAETGQMRPQDLSSAAGAAGLWLSMADRESEQKRCRRSALPPHSIGPAFDPANDASSRNSRNPDALNELGSTEILDRDQKAATLQLVSTPQCIPVSGVSAQ